ncbi:junctional protein associated with coronary artery disease [Amblyraja radiata]|uniref:junctional protein associated with coronary artery disease n=1 Tax=Amblyraja radiata TaxID=386614 RepID=UPI001403FA44|nr:junctional protein associated with coronary artery disease [Amblyraja radiata]
MPRRFMKMFPGLECLSYRERLNSGLPLPCSSGLHLGKDINYWRRRGQDFSGLLDYTNHGDSEGSNATRTRNIPKAEQRGRGSQEHQLKSKQHKAGAMRSDQQAGCTAEGKIMAESVVREDMWGTPMDRKCQSLGTEEWISSLGRQSSDSGGAKLRPNILPRVVSDEVFHKEGMENVRKGKSRSLPRVIPDINGKESRTGLHYVTTSSIDTDRLENQCLSDHLVLQSSASYSDPKTSSKWRENVRQSAQFAQLPKAKFSRPLNPPSYELYQQIRRSSEMIPSLHVRGENEGQGIDFARDQDHNSCPNLDPPVYVPPSSYKAQPRQHVGRKCFVKVPSCHKAAGQCSQSTRTGVDQPHWCCSQTGKNDQADQRQVFDENDTKRQLLQAENATDEIGNGAHHSRGSHSASHNGYSDDHKAFVKYIPFTDPRIRHITIVQPEKQFDETGYKQDQWPAADRDTDGNKLHGPSQHCSAFSVPSGSHYSSPVGPSPAVDPPTPGNSWSLPPKPENQNQAKSDHGYHTHAGDWCDAPPGHGVRPQGSQGAAETVTQVKKWAPDSRCFEGHGKKQPRRRMTETIFCLVSVPLKTPEEEGASNGNASALIGGGGGSTGNLTDQSFLSMSSSDLELQALTGYMAADNGPKRPEHWGEVSNKCEVASSFKRHRELRASGSWPGDQYKDQETQTSFGKGPRAVQLFASALKKDGTCKQNHSESEASAFMQGNRRGSEATVASDQKWKLSNHPMNEQTSLHPSSNSAFTRAAPTQYQVGKPPKSQPEGAPMSPCEKGRDVKVEKDRGCPQTSSSPAVGSTGFGQFLLKPVDRRPWDAISELENFNKEIQDHEDRNTQMQRDDGEEGEELFASQLISSDEVFPSTQMPLPRNSELCVPEKPLTNMAAPEEILEECCPDYSNITPEVHKAHSVSAVHNKLRGHLSYPLRKPASKGTANARRCTILNIFSTKSAQFTKLNNETNAEDTDSKSQCTKMNGLGVPTYQLSERKGGEVMDKNILVRDNAAGKTILPAPETRSNGIIRKMFFQFDSDQISLEPDLSSLISWKSTKPIIDEANDLLKQRPVRGISKTESFEERAARILGIDDAVEALISPVKKEQGRDVEEFEGNSPCVEELSHTCDPAMTNSKCTSGEVLGDDVGNGVENNNQLEWRDSPVYGICLPNRNSVLQDNLPEHIIENDKGLQSGKRALINEVFHEPFSEFYNWADRNCHFGTECKNTPLAGQDRKGRNTSGRIEALQGRLAAPQKHAAPDRLARMKEVDSVSRIRRLSIKSTDPADELDEAKCNPEQGDKEEPCTSVRKKDTCATKKRVLSRGEDSESFVSSIAVNTGSKEAGDAYDPSKVETV